MVKLYKSIFLIFIVHLFTSCTGFISSKMECAVSPTQYKEYYGTCLKNTDGTLPLMVMTCDERAYERTKFCY